MNLIDKHNQHKAEDFIVGSAGNDGDLEVKKIDHSQKWTSGYASRERIYPKRARGLFRRTKWIVMLVTLGIYYLLPWIRWPRVEGQPDQAILLDFEHQKLYFGPVEIWAQELYYITGVLVLSALGLFLVTSIAGRMWCGYACPQTVWTDLMIAIERFWQGDRAARIRLDKAPMSFNKAWKKLATHISWALVGLFTGGALVFYFRDAPTLAQELVTGTAPAIAYIFLGIFSATTYLLGGIAREQVCIYMCPWPRIQGAMLDNDSLMVSYRSGRGEPRAPYKRGDSWEGRGDCIECKACIAVCPTGIDIRDGGQLECIQCALCIDACDDVMTRIGRPKGLIAYATLQNAEAHTAEPREGWRIIRPRTILYTALITLISSVMLWSLFSRADMYVSVAPDRNPLFVRLSDGSVRNGYTLHIVNKKDIARKMSIKATGLSSSQLTLVGDEDRDLIVEAPASEVLNLKAYLAISAAETAALKSSNVPVNFQITDIDTGALVTVKSTFHGPKK